jgi:O-antigen/teichoic acid export membrane protein
MSNYYVADRQKLSAIFSASLTYLLVMATPIAFGISVLAGPIIAAVYGPSFAGSVEPLKILILSLFFAFLYWPAGSLLNACDRQASNTKIMGVTMVVNIILNAILVPRFGVIGAAVSAFIGNAVLFFGALYMTRDIVRLDEKHFVRPAALILFSGVLMSSTLMLLMDSVPLLMLIPLGAAVYLAGLFGTRAVTVDEVRRLVDIFLRRGKTVSDIVA